MCPVIKICMCAILRHKKTMANPWLRHVRVLAKANKMADSCTINFDVNSVALRRGCFMKKKTRFNSIFAVLRRFVALLGQFVTAFKI